MSFVIESGVPMVGTRRGRKATNFPFRDMEIGDSFVIPCDSQDPKAVANWRRKLLNAKRGLEAVFATAIVPEGLRVWRTE